MAFKQKRLELRSSLRPYPLEPDRAAALPCAHSNGARGGFSHGVLPLDTPALPRQENHHQLVEAAVAHILTERKIIGGQLGRPSGARYKTYTRLKAHAEYLQGTLFADMAPPLLKALDQIYKHPLQESAVNSLKRQLRSHVSDESLVSEENPILGVTDPVGRAKLRAGATSGELRRAVMTVAGSFCLTDFFSALLSPRNVRSSARPAGKSHIDRTLAGNPHYKKPNALKCPVSQHGCCAIPVECCRLSGR